MSLSLLYEGRFWILLKRQTKKVRAEIPLCQTFISLESRILSPSNIIHDFLSIFVPPGRPALCVKRFFLLQEPSLGDCRFKMITVQTFAGLEDGSDFLEMAFRPRTLAFASHAFCREVVSDACRTVFAFDAAFGCRESVR